MFTAVFTVGAGRGGQDLFDDLGLGSAEEYVTYKRATSVPAAKARL